MPRLAAAQSQCHHEYDRQIAARAQESVGDGPHARFGGWRRQHAIVMEVIMQGPSLLAICGAQPRDCLQPWSAPAKGIRRLPSSYGGRVVK